MNKKDQVYTRDDVFRGGRQPKLQKPDLDQYDMVILVEGGVVQYVAVPEGGSLKVLLIDLDEIEDTVPPAFEGYTPSTLEKACQLLREMAEEVYSLPEAEVHHAEKELEIENSKDQEEEEGEPAGYGLRELICEIKNPEVILLVDAAFVVHDHNIIDNGNELILIWSDTSGTDYEFFVSEEDARRVMVCRDQHGREYLKVPGRFLRGGEGSIRVYLTWVKV